MLELLPRALHGSTPVWVPEAGTLAWPFNPVSQLPATGWLLITLPFWKLRSSALPSLCWPPQPFTAALDCVSSLPAVLTHPLGGFKSQGTAPLPSALLFLAGSCSVAYCSFTVLVRDLIALSRPIVLNLGYASEPLVELFKSVWVPRDCSH